MLRKTRNSDGTHTMFTGDMADLLHVVSRAKREMIALHGPEKGQQEFDKLTAKSVLERFAVEIPLETEASPWDTGLGLSCLPRDSWQCHQIVEG